MSTGPICWATANAGATADGGEYLVKVEHFLDERSLQAFMRRMKMWVESKPEHGFRVEATPWRRLLHATNESPKQEMGLIKLSSERLAGLDAGKLATDLQQMASEAQQYVEEQRVFEQEQLGPWLEQLRKQ